VSDLLATLQRRLVECLTSKELERKFQEAALVEMIYYPENKGVVTIKQETVMMDGRTAHRTQAKQTNKQTTWPLVRKRTIPTERPPLVGESSCRLLWIEGCRVVSAADPPRSLISVF
jgi:hypothetical protein